MTASEEHFCVRCRNLVEPIKSIFDNRILWPDICEVCREDEDRERAEKEKRYRIGKLLAAANLPLEADNWDIETAASRGRSGFSLARCWRYGRQGLYIQGPAGVGKTVAAWVLLKRTIVEDIRSGLFMSVPELLAELRRGSSKAVRWEVQAKNVELLVMDDLGAEKTSEWVRETLYRIIDHRSNYRLPTIYTSNHLPRDLFKHLGDPAGRIVDRIIHWAPVVRFTGDSFRVQEGLARQRLWSERNEGVSATDR